MTRTIAVAIPKGGTGKTTTTINLGAALHERGQRVLLVDFDPQGNLTRSLGVTIGAKDPTIYTAIKRFIAYDPDIQHYLPIHTTDAGVDIIPTTPLLNRANEELVAAHKREEVLKELLAPIAPQYDFILIDTLPYLGVLVVNSLVAAQEVIVPLQTEYLATESTSLILDEIQIMRRRLNPALQITGILLTMVDQRMVIHRQAIEHAREVFGAQVPVFKTMIKRSVRFPESQASHQTMFQYEPQGEGARAYRTLAEEVLDAQA